MKKRKDNFFMGFTECLSTLSAGVPMTDPAPEGIEKSTSNNVIHRWRHCDQLLDNFWKI